MAAEINISSSTAQLAWLGMIAVSGLVGAVAGAPVLAVLVGCVLLCLPAMLAWADIRDAGPGPGLVVAAWVVVAVLAVAATGGPRSPLAILFVIAPLSGLAAGRRRMAIEATVFSAAAYLGLSGLNLAVASPVLSPEWFGFTACVTLATIAMAGLLVLAAIKAQKRRARLELGLRASEESVATVGAHRGVELPERAGIAVIAISPLGRIRAVQGDKRLLGSVGPGQEAAIALAAIDPGLAGGFHEKTQARRLERSSGALLATSHRLETGYCVILRPEASSRETDALESAFADKLAERTIFFASLGHDLKTPLNAIIGFADLMRNELRGPLPDAYRDYSDIIHESGLDLLLLIDDMLDLAKADANKLVLDFEPVDLAASGASVLRQLSVQAERSGVTLELAGESEAWARADARAVRQIWQNLVSNAIKYSERGGRVTLSVAEQGDRVILSVEDQGAGMDADDLRRLAEPFAQGRNSSGRPGTGLGLAVVKSFADLHDGQVRIETAPSAGTRVEVSFPPADPALLEGFEKAAQ